MKRFMQVIYVKLYVKVLSNFRSPLQNVYQTIMRKFVNARGRKNTLNSVKYLLPVADN